VTTTQAPQLILQRYRKAPRCPQAPEGAYRLWGGKQPLWAVGLYLRVLLGLVEAQGVVVRLAAIYPLKEEMLTDSLGMEEEKI
jgi:hypothetical protein